MFAALQTQVPWCAVVVRRAFGVALGIHLGPAPTVIAWPSAQSGSMPVEGGVELAFGREIRAAADPDARRRELEDEMAAAQSVFPRAEEFGVHHLIDPRETRPALCAWIDEIEPALARAARRADRGATGRGPERLAEERQLGVALVGGERETAQPLDPRYRQAVVSRAREEQRRDNAATACGPRRRATTGT